MNNAYINCASCGHQFPLDFVRQRPHFTCNCGMRLSQAVSVADTARTTFVVLVMLAMLAGLLSAGYFLVRKLLG